MNKSRYKKSGRIRMRKKENQKFSRKRREKLKKDENRQPESKTAMISVILVASALSISLMARSYALEEKIGDYKSQRKEVKAQISAEEQRTKEIEALKEYPTYDPFENIKVWTEDGFEEMIINRVAKNKLKANNLLETEANNATKQKFFNKK